MDPVEGITYGIIALMLALIPALVARVKKHHNTNSIFLLTVVAIAAAAFAPAAGAVIWLAALIWAFSNPAGKKE